MKRGEIGRRKYIRRKSEGTLRRWKKILKEIYNSRYFRRKTEKREGQHGVGVVYRTINTLQISKREGRETE